MDRPLLRRALNSQLARNLEPLLRAHRLEIPDDPDLIDELINLRIVERPAVNRGSNTAGHHNDQAIAIALTADQLLNTPPRSRSELIVLSGATLQPVERRRLRAPAAQNNGHGVHIQQLHLVGHIIRCPAPNRRLRDAPVQAFDLVIAENKARTRLQERADEDDADREHCYRPQGRAQALARVVSAGRQPTTLSGCPGAG